MIPSFRTADRQTCRRVVIVGVLFCLAFVVISFSPRPQSEGRPAEADRRRGPSGQLAEKIRDQKGGFSPAALTL